MKKNFFPLLAVCLCLGCSDTKNTDLPAAVDPVKETKAPLQSDNPDAVAALQKIGAELKISSAGLITEVNLRDTNATNDDLEQVAALSHVSSVLLNDLPVSDDGLAILAKTTSPIANLDLRGCPVTNLGLSHLSTMKSLRALRLNGVNGKTTVDDGGMVHLAGLTNLKVLALDGL